MYTKTTFWDNTQGIFPIEAEGEFYDLITQAVNRYSNEKEFECVFNTSRDAFFIRTKEFAVRISNRWGKVGNCKWELERDKNQNKFQMVIIHYNQLRKL